MPMIDMPLEKLYEYGGRNPRPADFDAFWERSLAELEALEPAPEFIPADFSSSVADAYDLYFTSVKGARLHAKLLKPKGVSGRMPAVLMFHGLSGDCGDWVSKIPYASEGFVVAALDTRGQGGCSQDVGSVYGTSYTTPFMRGFDGAPEELYGRDVFLDTVMLARVVTSLQYVDAGRVCATGGSQGGALTVACAALFPSLKLAAPVYPYMADYKRVWEMDLDKGAYEGIRYYFRHFDPRHERVDEIFTKLGYIDLQFLASRIRAKTLMGTGLMDTTCPPSTQFAIYNKMTCDKEVLIYPDFGHENLTGHSDVVFRFIRDNL